MVPKNIINFPKRIWQSFIKFIDKIGISVWILLIIVFTIAIQYAIEDRFPNFNFALSALSAVAIWWVCHHKYQSIQSPPKLKKNSVNAGGFTWISLQSKGVPEFLKPEREASGLMWNGFAPGVSKENGKIGSITIWLYGSNEGVGHYLYFDRTNGFDTRYGSGHFRLKGFPKQDLSSWMDMTLEDACELIAKKVGQFYRPLLTVYDEKRKAIYWHDNESGRDVYAHKPTSSSDDLFLFGPYPKKLKNFVGHVEKPRLIATPVERAEKDSPKRIIINAKDIYGQPLKHVYVQVKAESGYSYAQILPSNGEFMTITVPQPLQKLTIKVCRGGYGNLMEEVDIEVGDIKVEAILEPLRE